MQRNAAARLALADPTLSPQECAGHLSRAKQCFSKPADVGMEVGGVSSCSAAVDSVVLGSGPSLPPTDDSCGLFIVHIMLFPCPSSGRMYN